MDNFQSLVLLNMVGGIGSVRLKRLLEAFVEPRRIFQAQLKDLIASGALTHRMARRVLEAPGRFDVEKELLETQEMGFKILTQMDADYPKALKEIYDPPYVLYMKGALIPSDDNAVSVVGSRGASFYGLKSAAFFASSLARFGLTIVSGMARGVDTAAHRACLDAGGRSIAVLGSGLKRVYPPENRGLFEAIADRGAVLSEFPLDTPPEPQNFPIRNRIVSGLSRGVLVVEATQRSGALITARSALEQGREVFAIPGEVGSLTSFGTNELIKQGASLVTEPGEILRDIQGNLRLSRGGV